MKDLKLVSNTDGVRIDSWLAKELEGYSRSYLQKLIEQDLVYVNGKKIKANYKVKKGDEISITIPEPETLDIEPENIPLDILYEDEHILVVNKPKGMVVHPAAGNYSGTLVNAIMNYCGDNLSDINGIIRPGIVHRLDKDTSGALIVAKTNEAHKIISEKLKEHDITRIYIALVKGIIKEDKGKIDLPIGRHPIDRKKMAVNTKNGRKAVTHYRVLERFDDSTYVELSLETGRTHQIRVHMSYIGHPVIGDEVYGGRQKGYNLKGQALHAKCIKFHHPITGEYMHIEAPIPDYFEKLLKEKRRRMSNNKNFI
ncbi:MAG TPA: RluA family pseudouridine synthase [Clostridiaceae bacterium]|nr:RluA family pseudouridine synthase [Clostridiaceae bacterium]